jgi:predicted enzyme related to lactoylglutathione lyase
MSNPVVWFEVVGQDADKLRQFYGELLGWEFQVSHPTRYGKVHPHNGGIPGGVGQAPRGEPGWTTFYTWVPDLERTMAEATALGSQVLMEIEELPDRRRIAVVTDPEGRPLGLCSGPA